MPRFKRPGKGLLKLVISGALLVVLVSRIDITGTLAVVAEARWVGCWTALGLFILGIFVRAYRWNVLVQALHMRVSLGQLTGLYFVGSFFSTVLPTGIGGDAVKAAELARHTGRVGESLGTVVTDRFLGIIVLLAIGDVALLLGRSSVDPRLTWTVAVLFTAGIVGFGLLRNKALMLRFSRLIPEVIKAPVMDLYESFQAYDLGALFHALAASLAFNVLWIGVNLLLGWSLAIEASLYHYLVFVPLVSLSLLLPSVGGLGVRELTYVGLFGLVGVAEERAFALGILVYAVHVATGLIGGTIYLIQGAREYRPTGR
jgi:uncharacterized protein (TIRG00374 family)